MSPIPLLLVTLLAGASSSFAKLAGSLRVRSLQTSPSEGWLNGRYWDPKYYQIIDMSLPLPDFSEPPQAPFWDWPRGDNLNGPITNLKDSRCQASLPLAKSFKNIIEGPVQSGSGLHTSYSRAYCEYKGWCYDPSKRAPWNCFAPVAEESGKIDTFASRKKTCNIYAGARIPALGAFPSKEHCEANGGCFFEEKNIASCYWPQIPRRVPVTDYSNVTPVDKSVRTTTATPPTTTTTTTTTTTSPPPTTSTTPPTTTTAVSITTVAPTGDCAPNWVNGRYYDPKWYRIIDISKSYPHIPVPPKAPFTNWPRGDNLGPVTNLKDSRCQGPLAKSFKNIIEGPVEAGSGLHTSLSRAYCEYKGWCFDPDRRAPNNCYAPTAEESGKIDDFALERKTCNVQAGARVPAHSGFASKEHCEANGACYFEQAFVSSCYWPQIPAKVPVDAVIDPKCKTTEAVDSSVTTTTSIPPTTTTTTTTTTTPPPPPSTTTTPPLPSTTTPTTTTPPLPSTTTTTPSPPTTSTTPPTTTSAVSVTTVAPTTTTPSPPTTSTTPPTTTSAVSVTTVAPTKDCNWVNGRYYDPKYYTILDIRKQYPHIPTPPKTTFTNWPRGDDLTGPITNLKDPRCQANVGRSDVIIEGPIQSGSGLHTSLSRAYCEYKGWCYDPSRRAPNNCFAPVAEESGKVDTWASKKATCNVSGGHRYPAHGGFASKEHCEANGACYFEEKNLLSCYWPQMPAKIPFLTVMDPKCSPTA